MLLRVIYPDGKQDMVKDVYLDHLIETKKIKAFKRSSGWAILGVDFVRDSRNCKNYSDLGFERRCSPMSVSMDHR